MYSIESALYGINREFIEELYQRFLKSPASVSEQWQAFFKENGLSLTQGPAFQVSEIFTKRAVIDDGSIPFPPPQKTAPAKTGTAEKSSPASQSVSSPQKDIFFQAVALINAYRIYGHFKAKLNPLAGNKGKNAPAPVKELELKTYGFQETDHNLPLDLKGLLGLHETTVGTLLQRLEETYCGSLAIEFMYILPPEEREWLQERMEHKGSFTTEEQQKLLKSLTRADTFERFLHVKYPGAKRFGLDGGESLIPALEEAIETAVQQGAEEIILGMAHRGRLNVLHNILRKPFSSVLQEFQGKSSVDIHYGSGDVKYHLGFSSEHPYQGKSLHLSLAANPSHLEAVNPVVLGKTRAKQKQRNDHTHQQVLCITIHGDAAFAGQGVVAECLMLSQLTGYKTGGTLHIIINNQIGFTTNPEYSRSSFYCSAPAYTIQAPIFHVNADDPEAVLTAIKLAADFRYRFKRDVVVELVCYRRYGHNESDEPAFTQPLMYETIASHPSTRALYAQKIQPIVSAQTAEEWVKEVEAPLQQAFEQTTAYVPTAPQWLTKKWAEIVPYQEYHSYQTVSTGVKEEELQRLGHLLTITREGFSVHSKIERQLVAKQQMMDTKEHIDWATAEALAFATLLSEGKNVRLSGQDCGRGTFSQRHIVLTDQKSEERYIPLLQVLSPSSGYLEVIDSPLAEMSVLGFEYGYSLTDPQTLVLWEGQFGDFANGAQVIMDQFISAGEMKWLRMSGLVMLLPHGYEGMGPEHSSARLERYLQLCANNNMQVANCTTPASYFHILRRQLHQPFRKPLILMTPKSLLRHRLAVSSLREMAESTTFHPVLPDSSVDPKKIRKVIFCSGKVYYDLVQKRVTLKTEDCALIRLEQLYPFPEKSLLEQLALYPQAEIVWCQEEPHNMGAWTFVKPLIEKALEKMGRAHKIEYAGRPEAASPATGYAPQHTLEQDQLVTEALK